MAPDIPVYSDTISYNGKPCKLNTGFVNRTTRRQTTEFPVSTTGVAFDDNAWSPWRIIGSGGSFPTEKYCLLPRLNWGRRARPLRRASRTFDALQTYPIARLCPTRRKPPHTVHRHIVCFTGYGNICSLPKLDLVFF